MTDDHVRMFTETETDNLLHTSAHAKLRETIVSTLLMCAVLTGSNAKLKLP